MQRDRHIGRIGTGIRAVQQRRLEVTVPSHTDSSSSSAKLCCGVSQAKVSMSASSIEPSDTLILGSERV